MFKQGILFTFLVVIISISDASSVCPGPLLMETIKSYTTTDASVLTAIAYIHEFKVTCNGKPIEGVQFYADINAGQKQIPIVYKEGLYQVSWTEEISKAAKGIYNIKVFDDEGYSNFKRSKTPESVEALGSLELNHPGAYSGPWLSSEHLAAILGIGVVYIAISCRSKLLS